MALSGPLEKTSERRVIVYKTCVDPKAIKLAAEKMKKELFVRKTGFWGPKRRES